ncbi:MAG TPA: DUF1878 family protein [Bacillales bacterium]|nr:DUF1878 family protein [Bacillales bacterium]
MMDDRDLYYRINLLEYHQKLLLKLLSNPKLDFYRLVVEKGLNEEQVQNILNTCEKMSKKISEQKEEGFIYFSPLFNEFSSSIPTNLQVKDLISACISQHIFEPLMREFEKYIEK